MTRWTDDQLAAYQAGKREAVSAVPTERDELRACLELLKLDPKIGWAVRLNIGAARLEGTRYVRFGIPGMSDIIGQTKTGMWFAWEVKRAGAKPTDLQAAFLGTVASFGGFSGFGTAADLQARLAQWPG